MYDEDDMELESLQPPKDILFDIIYEMCGYLEHNGFTAELRLDWPERNISILMKYADRSYNIDVETVYCV